MTVTFDTSVLLGWYQAKAGIAASGAGANGSASGPAKKVAPTAPWNQIAPANQSSQAVMHALAGNKIIDENAAKLDLPGASQDYKKLFALWQGLGTLSDLATQWKTKGQTQLQQQQLAGAFAKGMTEVQNYIASSNLSIVRLTQGTVNTQDTASLESPKTPTQYVTGPLATSSSDDVPAFDGDVQFTISVQRLNQTIDVPIDLTALGSQTRSLANVINYVNGQLAAAGVETRLATNRTPGKSETIGTGANAITLPPGPDQWAMAVNIGTDETVSFSAPQTAPALYVAQQVGDPHPTASATGSTGSSTSTSSASDVQQQLLKFQTDESVLPAPPQPTGQSNWVDGRVFAQNLDPNISKVVAQTVGSDGSVYMLANVTGTVDGQAIQGSQDVALLKYDSAGNLIYSRTLGAADTASGMSLAVSSDGKVAVAGSVSGTLEGATDGPLNSGTTGAFAGDSDSFVTQFDADGNEVWTQRRGATQNDEADQVAFGSDGTVYVAGRTQSALPGSQPLGDWDSYIEGFKQDPTTGKVQTVFTQSFGAARADKLVGLAVDGASLVTASIENGDAVLRKFDLSSGTPQQVAQRDLGNLKGGSISGIAVNNGQVVIAGTTSNAQLDAGAVTSASSGGTDAFAASVSDTLAPSSGDKIAYYGGSGDDKLTAMTVSSDGQVWLAGTSSTDLPNEPPVGKTDTFLASLDVSTGQVGWQRRYTGTDNIAAPTAIATSSAGASVLDRLGLPTGAIQSDGSEDLTSLSSLRPGDNFTVSTGTGIKGTVAIATGETLKSLATKIEVASGYNATVTVQAAADGGKQLKIVPANTHAIVTIGAGKTDQDALKLLGISPGVVQDTVTNKNGTTTPADGKSTMYGLSLDATLNLSDADQVSHALAQLAHAQNVIQGAYGDLVKAASPHTAQTHAASGPVPQYLKDQISNYQAALQRLTGGSSSSSSAPGYSVASLL